MLTNKIFSAIDAVCREPYRLFFPVGIWMGLVGVSPWILYGFGLAQNYSPQFHSSIQTLVYINCFVIGFLTTFIPRFIQTSYASKSEVFSLLFLFIGIAIFLRIEQWMAAHVFYIIWLIFLIRFFLVRIPRRKKEGPKGNAPQEMMWIPLAVLHGIIGTVLLILGEAGILPKFVIKVGKPMMEQGFILGVVLGVGGFLIPRIMGTYQADTHQHNDNERVCCQHHSVPLRKKYAISFHSGCAFLFFISFWLEGADMVRYAYFLRALVVTAEFIWSKTLLNFPQKKDFYIKLAWISAWLVVLGLWLAGIFPDYKIVALHLSFIGGFSLMIYAIATMVVLSHIGQAQKLNQPLVILWIVFLALALAMMKRTIVIVYPDEYFKFMGYAAISWSVAAVCWLIYILPKVFIVPPQDEFARMHEEAKRKLEK